MHAAQGRRALRASVAAVATALSWTHAQAQEDKASAYPRKPVRILSSSIQGGGTDVVARMAAQGLSDRSGRAVVVDNRPGGAGILAMDLTRQAVPDGYTLLVTAASLMATATVLKRVSYDVRTEFAPVAQLTIQPYLLVVHPSLPVRSVQELIAYAKARPGALNYASTGPGSASHLGTELFSALAGIKMVHISFKAAGPALIEVLGGRDQFVFLSSVISAAPHVKSGALRALAVSSARRSRAYPELPTMREAGVKGFELNNWYGCFAPRGTPAPIVSTLNGLMHEIMSSPPMTARLEAVGAEPAPKLAPQELRRVLAEEVEMWDKFVRTSGLKEALIKSN